MIPNLILWYFLLVQNLQTVVIRFLHFIINFGQHPPECRGQVPLTQCTHSSNHFGISPVTWVSSVNYTIRQYILTKGIH